MLAKGVGASQARSLVGRMYEWARSREAEGHTPTLRSQVRWVERLSGVAISFDEVRKGIDGALLRAEVRPAPGALRTLDRWRKAGIPLGLVSNILYESGEAARMVLERTGLLSRFDAVFLSCDHPWSKPRPEPFRWTLRRMGASASGSCHVGDLRFDVEGARRAGMAAVLYTGLHRLEKPRPGIPLGVPRRRRIARWVEAPAAVRAAVLGPRPSY